MCWVTFHEADEVSYHVDYIPWILIHLLEDYLGFRLGSAMVVFHGFSSIVITVTLVVVVSVLETIVPLGK